LCLLPDNEAAVTLPRNSTIHVISVSSKKLSHRRAINVNTECWGIDIVNDYFVVGKVGKVALIDQTGTVFKSASRDSKGKSIFKFPHYICASFENSNKVIYVSDHGTKKITRLNEDLRVLQTFMCRDVPCPRDTKSLGSQYLLVVNWKLGEPSTLYTVDVTTGRFTLLLGRQENLRGMRCVATKPGLESVYVTQWLDGYDMVTEYRIK